jgi:hypothetical protein
MGPSKKTHPQKLHSFAAITFIFVFTSVVCASETKVVVRKSVSESHRAELADKLKLITGWRDLRFMPNGTLVLGTVRANFGSSTARELLSRTVSGDRVILLEDASGRKDVAFCRVDAAAWANELPANRSVYVVLIDFADFKQVSGDRKARAAFDVGWAVLHEIDHVVENSVDPMFAGETGECESHINKMRQELGLPVRTDYYFSVLPVRSDSGFLISKFVRLGFDYHDRASGKTKRYWLLWDAVVVGGLESGVQTASLF